MTETIQCKYSCAECGIEKRTVTVRARNFEDVVEWMEKTLTPALINDHALFSPHCHPKSFTSVMIPIDPDEGTPIGKNFTKK